jgi:LysR family transcriptional regulator for metE and metH
MVERTHLTILRAIHRTGTLAAASEELCVTQSALSQSIKKLEQQFSITLWEKAGRKIRLTESGQYLLGVANRVLPQLEHVDLVLEKFSAGTRGALRIGMECHPCYRWLLQIIGPYLKQWPEVDVDVRKQFTFKGLAALYQYEVDILVTPDPIMRRGVKFYPVFDYEQVLVVPTNHQFAQREWIEPEDLSGEILITYPVERERLDIFRDFMTPAKIFPNKHIHIEDTDILLQMVASGRGVSALPKWLVEELRTQFSVQAVSLGEKGVHQKIYIGIRDEEYHPQYLMSFLKTAGADVSEQVSDKCKT